MITDIVLFITMLIGIAFIAFSWFMPKKEDKSYSTDYLEIENTIRAVDQSVKEADSAIENLNRLSTSVFEEFEQKYQEILFLYSLMDEKKKEIADIYAKPLPSTSSESDSGVETPSEEPVLVLEQERLTPVAPLRHPNYDEIMKLSDEGMPVAEIAKELDMGQGEVKLIIELGKGR